MVDSADLGFYGAAWRFTDFCQQLFAGSVYLQFVLKSCELRRLVSWLSTIQASRKLFVGQFFTADVTEAAKTNQDA